MNDCLFCKISKGEIPTDFVYQDEDFVAFKDTNPKAPVHILIVTKKHLSSLNEAEEEDKALLGKGLLMAKEIAQKQGVAKSGYRIGINCGKEAGQEVFHLHIHLMGGWKKEKAIQQKGE